MAEGSDLPQWLKILAWLQIPLIGVAVVIYVFIFLKLPPLLKQQSDLKKSIDQLQTTKNGLENRIAQLNTTISVIPQKQLEDAIEAAPQKITSRIPPRIYVQIATEKERHVAEFASTKLRSAGFLVPGIEDVGTQRAPNLTEIRYFAPEEQGGPDLKAIEQTLSGAGIPAVPKYIAPKPTSKIRPRHFELWFGKNTSIANR